MMRAFLVALSLFSCALGMSIRKNSSEVSFSLYATNLRKCDLITACDTSVTVLCQSIQSDWKLCDRTKTIRNNNNPVWPKIFTFDHVPGTRQRWRLDLNEHNLFGLPKIIASFMINIDEYVESDIQLVEHPIPNDRGSLWMNRISPSS